MANKKINARGLVGHYSKKISDSINHHVIDEEIDSEYIKTSGNKYIIDIDAFSVDKLEDLKHGIHLITKDNRAVYYFKEMGFGNTNTYKSLKSSEKIQYIIVKK